MVLTSRASDGACAGALAECHQLMGIDESTNAAAAKKAYRKKSMQLHPDKPGGSEEAMTKLNICKELVLIDCQHKRQGRGGHSSPSPPKSERSDDAAEEAEEAEEAPPASGKAVAAPPSAADLAGFYCGDKEVDLLLTSAEARLVLKIDPESDTAGVFAFKVSGGAGPFPDTARHQYACCLLVVLLLSEALLLLRRRRRRG